MKTCETCKFWDQVESAEFEHRICFNDMMGNASSQKALSVYMNTYDGHGFQIQTGPNFGCIHHKAL